MNKHLTTIVVLGLALLIVSGCAALAQTLDARLTTDPNSIEAIAIDIANFGPPSGYKPDYGARWNDYALAAYSLGDGPNHLYVAKIPPEADLDSFDPKAALRKLGGRSVDPQLDRYSGLEIVGTRFAFVDGKEVTVVISEGTSGEGVRYREIATGFTIDGDQIFVVWSEETDRWDWTAVEAVLSSIN